MGIPKALCDLVLPPAFAFNFEQRLQIGKTIFVRLLGEVSAVSEGSGLLQETQLPVDPRFMPSASRT